MLKGLESCDAHWTCSIHSRIYHSLKIIMIKMNLTVFIHHDIIIWSQVVLIDTPAPFIAMESSWRAFKQVTLPHWCGSFFIAFLKSWRLFFPFFLAWMSFTFGWIKTQNSPNLFKHESGCKCIFVICLLKAHFLYSLEPKWKDSEKEENI